jgi:hypothetical protein
MEHAHTRTETDLPMSPDLRPQDGAREPTTAPQLRSSPLIRSLRSYIKALVTSHAGHAQGPYPALVGEFNSGSVDQGFVFNECFIGKICRACL